MYLVNIRIAFRVCQRIEDCVEFIEHFYNFHSALGTCVYSTVLTEAHNAGEHQCHGVVSLSVLIEFEICSIVTALESMSNVLTDSQVFGDEVR